MYQPCAHNIYIKGLCGDCGIRLDPPQSTSVSMVHSVPELKVSEQRAKEIGTSDQERLIAERKLVLLVDLDQTILHTTHERVEDDPNVHSFNLWPGHPTYYTKLRPHLEDFLERISQKYELHIFTFGCRRYAHKIASIIDPSQKYFGNRILSRDESVDQYSKKGNLNNLFPCGDSMVCIIDDRSDVWKEAGNLIQVKAYSYFKTSISDGAQRRHQQQQLEDDDSIDKDVDKLEALLGLDDDEGEAEEDDKNSESANAKDSLDDKSQDAKGSKSEEQTLGKPESSDSSTEDSDTGASAGDSERLNTDSHDLSKETLVADEVGDVGAEDEDDDNQRRSKEESPKKKVRFGGEQHEQLEQRQNQPEASHSTEFTDQEVAKDLTKKAPAPTKTIISKQSDRSPSNFEDTDDQLLKLPRILEWIHSRWYLEFDEQTEFLSKGERYKLPDIKDIIRRYIRKY